MKIFITGIAGFLGSHLADRMIALGHEVMGVDSLIGGEQANVPENAEFAIADCANLTSMTKHMAGCDIVIHAACTAYEGLSVFSPSLVTQNTFQITSTLLSAAIQNKVKRFVFCSSMARYGSQEVIPFTEDMICNPEDPYGIAKHASELLIKNLCKVHNMEYVIAVPHNIIGNRQKYDDPFRNVASIMINMMLQGKQPIIYGDGSQIREWISVHDHVAALRQIMNDGERKQIYNIGSGDRKTNLEIAKKILSVSNSTSSLVFIQDRKGHDLRYALNSSYLGGSLGWRPHHDIDSDLPELVGFYRSIFETSDLKNKFQESEALYESI